MSKETMTVYVSSELDALLKDIVKEVIGNFEKELMRMIETDNLPTGVELGKMINGMGDEGVKRFIKEMEKK